MVVLDTQLILEANRLLNGANVHRIKEMIFAYEQAVDLHNRHSLTHAAYHRKSELLLRQYVMKSKLDDLERMRIDAVERSEQASRKSTDLVESYDRIEQRLSEWSRAH